MNQGGTRCCVRSAPCPHPTPPPSCPGAHPNLSGAPKHLGERRTGCRGRAMYGGNGGGVDPESLEKDNDVNIHALGDRVGLLRQVRDSCMWHAACSAGLHIQTSRRAYVVAVLAADARHQVGGRLPSSSA